MLFYYLYPIFIGFILTATNTISAISYADIGNAVLHVEPAFKPQDIVAQKLPDYKERESSEIPHFSLPTSNLPEQLRLVFLLFHTFLPHTEVSCMGIAEQEALHILNAGGKKGNCLLHNFPTQTACGKATVAQKLANPLTDLRAIRPVQAIVKELVSQQQLHTNLQDILRTIAVQEPTILSFFETSKPVTKKVLNRLYYSDDQHNTSIKKIALLRGWQTFCTEPLFVIPRLAATYAMMRVSSVAGHYLHKRFLGIERNQDVLGIMQQVESDYPWEVLGPHHQSMWEKIKYQLGQMQTLDTTLNRASLVVAALQEMTVKYLFNQSSISLDGTTLAHMKAQLLVITHFIEQIQKLKMYCDSTADLPTKFSGYQPIVDFLATQDAQLLQLFALLESGTFHNQSSYFLDSARILVAYKLMEQCKELFIPVLAALGELDALCAAATLYNSAQTHTNRSCFVEFSDTTLPTIQLHNFWNPLMDPQEAVANTVNLGQSGDANMVITGPNGSGKSVFMKSVALNLILAQAFGIAAADAATLSVFDTFHIYLNIQENLELSLSTFMAEKKKMDEICKQVAEQPAGKKSFTLIDEGLKGTVEQSGGPHIYQAGIAMSNTPGNICLLATHFRKPTDLEQDTHGAFANYHLELLEPQENNFVRKFTLVKGKSDWWFADDAKRERFIAWLTSP